MLQPRRTDNDWDRVRHRYTHATDKEGQHLFCINDEGAMNES